MYRSPFVAKPAVLADHNTYPPYDAKLTFERDLRFQRIRIQVERRPGIEIPGDLWVSAAMTDDEVEEAARSDPDALPLTDEDIERIKRTRPNLDKRRSEKKGVGNT